MITVNSTVQYSGSGGGRRRAPWKYTTSPWSQERAIVVRVATLSSSTIVGEFSPQLVQSLHHVAAVGGNQEIAPLSVLVLLLCCLFA